MSMLDCWRGEQKPSSSFLSGLFLEQTAQFSRHVGVKWETSSLDDDMDHFAFFLE